MGGHDMCWGGGANSTWHSPLCYYYNIQAAEEIGSDSSWAYFSSWGHGSVLFALYAF